MEGVVILKKVRRHCYTDFSALQLLPYNWDVEDDNPAMEKKIISWNCDLNDACLIHYNMDTKAVQRFCGGRQMNEHHCNLQMLKVMSHIIPTDHFLTLGAGLVNGVPNFLYGNVPLSKLESNLLTPNLPTATKNPEPIDKAIEKEERNHLSLYHSNVVTTFVPDVGIIKLGVVDKQGRKLRPYRHRTRETEEVSNPNNVCCDAKAIEPKVKIGIAVSSKIMQMICGITKLVTQTPQLTNKTMISAVPLPNNAIILAL